MRDLTSGKHRIETGRLCGKIIRFQSDIQFQFLNRDFCQSHPTVKVGHAPRKVDALNDLPLLDAPFTGLRICGVGERNGRFFYWTPRDGIERDIQLVDGSVPSAMRITFGAGEVTR